MNKPKQGDLRVWWIPQLGMPGKPFYWHVASPEEGKLLLDVLAQYDLYQLHNRIKPDFSNVGGLSIWDENSDGEGKADWIDWMDTDGFDIDQHYNNLKEEGEEPRLLIPMSIALRGDIGEWLRDQLNEGQEPDYYDRLREFSADIEFAEVTFKRINK